MDNLLYLKKLGKGQNKLIVRNRNCKFNWSPRKRRKRDWYQGNVWKGISGWQISSFDEKPAIDLRSSVNF